MLVSAHDGRRDREWVCHFRCYTKLSVILRSRMSAYVDRCRYISHRQHSLTARVAEKKAENNNKQKDSTATAAAMRVRSVCLLSLGKNCQVYFDCCRHKCMTHNVAAFSGSHSQSKSSASSQNNRSTLCHDIATSQAILFRGSMGCAN